jgi:hypothetical protein
MEMTISGKRPELITIFEAQSRLAIRDGVGMLLRSAANMEAIFQWCSEVARMFPNADHYCPRFRKATLRSPASRSRMVPNE